VDAAKPDNIPAPAPLMRSRRFILFFLAVWKEAFCRKQRDRDNGVPRRAYAAETTEAGD